MSAPDVYVPHKSLSSAFLRCLKNKVRMNAKTRIRVQVSRCFVQKTTTLPSNVAELSRSCSLLNKMLVYTELIQSKSSARVYSALCLSDDHAGGSR